MLFIFLGMLISGGRCYPVPPNLNHMGDDKCRGLFILLLESHLGKEVMIG